jgi:sulfur carrier protein
VTADGAGVAVTVNGEEHAVERGATVASLLDALGTEQRGIAVAVDGEVVSRSTWDARQLAGGERVEILSITRGG